MQIFINITCICKQKIVHFLRILVAEVGVRVVTMAVFCNYWIKNRKNYLPFLRNRV